MRNVGKITKTDNNLNIISFMLEYIELYINHKKSCNVAKNKAYNINGALERFLNTNEVKLLRIVGCHYRCFFIIINRINDIFY